MTLKQACPLPRLLYTDLTRTIWLVGWILWHVNSYWVILCQRRFCFIHPFGYLEFFFPFFYELNFFYEFMF